MNVIETSKEKKMEMSTCEVSNHHLKSHQRILNIDLGKRE